MGTKREILDTLVPRMEKSMEHFESELSNVKAGKASPNVLNSVMVESYGSEMPINQVASVTVPDAKTILIQPWDKKMLGPIEKAIINSNLGMAPSNNGDVIRLNVPPLTEERRKQLVKQIKIEAETARVSLRGHRRDVIEAIKKAIKADGLPEDVAKDGEAEAQKVYDKFNKRIDDTLAAKEKEIMT
ncbi:MAG: ribosome recycling factor, partial [Mucinivorans sp.]